MMAYGKDHEIQKSPHWMKTMEDKYKKLHAMVLDQGCKMTQSRNNLSARIRELRNQRYQHITTKVQAIPFTRPTTSKPNLTDNVVLTSNKLCSTSAGNVTVNQNESPKIFRPKTAHPKLTSNQINNNNNNHGSTGNHKPLRQCRKQRSHSASDFEETISKHQEDELENYPPKEHDRGMNMTNAHEEGSSQEDQAGLTTTSPIWHNDKDESVQIAGNLLITSHKKTSGTNDVTTQDQLKSISSSTISQNNPKNYNHKKKTNKFSNRRKPKSAPPLGFRRNGALARTQVFSHMSEEAQYAKHETLKEMTSNGKGLAETENVSNYNLQQPNEINNALNDTEVRRKQVANFVKSTESVQNTDKSQNLSSIGNSSNISNSSDGNMWNIDEDQQKVSLIKQTGDKKQTKPLNKRTSEFPFPRSPHHKSTPKAGSPTKISLAYDDRRPPLPPILPRDHEDHDTFEITSPEFDVRFHQSPPHRYHAQDMRSEDILQQSIEKCRLWLEQQLNQL